MVAYTSHAEKIANTTAARLLSIPGVNIVRAGRKIRHGVDTGCTCISVGVTRKRSLADIPDAERIPGFVSGIQTDVVESPIIRAMSAHHAKHRPVIGGISGYINTPGLFATLGGVVVDDLTGRLVGLTNNHCAGLLYDTDYGVPVAGNAITTGLDFLQPSPGDGGTLETDQLGEVVRAVAMRFGESPDVPMNTVDAAIVSLPVIGDGWFSILNAHAGPFPFGIAATTMTVAKSGRTTGFQTGTVTSTNVAINVLYGPLADNNVGRFTNQIEVTGAGFLSGGDSGSFLLAIIGGKIHVVGLCFAGDGATLGFANKISDVASLLNVSDWDGSVVVPRSMSIETTVNGTVFLRSGDTTRAVTHEEDA